MRNMQRWFSRAVMAALVQSLLGSGLFTSANGAPQSANPTLAISDVNVNEGNAGTTDVLVAVTLANPNGQTVSVDYEVVAGSATAGSDYTVLSTFGTMTFFNGGATTQRVRITIIGDTANEPNETFFVNLSNAKNAALADNQAAGTIVNDDGGGGANPTLAIADVSTNEGNAGTTDVLFAVTLTNPNGQTITVDYQVVEGSAAAGSDYTVLSTSGTMTFFTGGATTQRIRVTIIGDAANEPDETFVVNLSNATNATLTDNQAVGTIINDDEIILPPVPPINLTATATSASTAALAWMDNSNNEDGFKIERKISGGNFSEIITVGSSITSFNDTGLNACATYIYRVRAFIGTANSGFSNEASATTTGCVNPPMLSIADVSTNEGNTGTTDVLVPVTLTNPNSQTVTVDYQVVEGSAAAGSDYTVLSTSGTMTFFTGGATTQRIRVTILGDTVNEPDETFVINLGNATNATLSDAQGVGTIVNDDAAPMPPNAPGNLAATATGASTIALTWADHSNDEDGFKIERKISGGSFSEIAAPVSNANSFNDTGLDASTTYVYRVRAYKSTAHSDYSNEATATTNDGPMLAIADVSTNEGDAGTTDVLVAVTLTNPNGQTVTVDYQVVDGSATAGSDYTVFSTSGTMTFFNGGATTQRIRVTINGDATNEPDETFFVNLSNATNATLTDNQSVGTIINDDGVLAPPNAPGNLTADFNGAMVILTWTDNSTDESSFEIQRKAGTGSYSIIGTVPGNITSASFTGLGDVETHTYRVRACNGSGCSSYSNEASPIFPPSNLTATATGASTVTLTWTDNSSSEHGFKIERKTGAGAFSGIATVNANATSFNDAGLEACTMYVYRVRAYKLSPTGFIESEIYSSYSNETSATTTGCAISPTLSIADVSTNEGNTGTTDVLVAVTLSNPNSQTVTVDYQIVDGSAEAGSDYTVLSASGTMTFFNGGATTQRIRVTIIGDAVIEPDETFVVNLSNATNATLTDNQGVGTIINDDGLVPPVAPSQLTVTTMGSSTFQLAWMDNSNDEDGFRIERKINGGSFSEIATVGSNITLFNNSGLSAGTIYFYRVRAFKGLLNSSYSNEASGSVLIEPPLAPDNLAAGATGTSTVSLTWTDNSSDEDGFKIERKLSGGNFSEITTVGSNITVFNDAGLSVGTAYVYRVRAFKATLNSTYSNEATVTTLAPPNAPSNLSAITASPSTASLVWTDNSSDEDGFKIERKISGGSFSEIMAVGGNVNFFDDAGLSAGTTYIYRVRAFKGALNSDYSNEATVTTVSLPPNPPSNLSATATGTTTVSLAWMDNSSDEDGFRIERKPSGGSFNEIITVGSNITSFNDAGLSAGATYVYRVRAFKAALNSNYSNEATVTTSSLPPNPPDNLSATATGTTTVSLAWTDNSSDETGFKIERKLNGGNFSEIATTVSNVNSFNDAGLSANTTYVYRVRAFKAALNSNYTNEAAVTTFVGSTTNLALNKPIAASSTYPPRPVTNAVDGSTDTYWRSDRVSNSSPPTWLRVDLGAAMVVSEVVVKWRDNYYAINYEAQVSNDDVNWTTVSTATGAAGAQTLNFSQRTARYVRINLLLNQKSNYRVEEFEVYSGTVTKPHAIAAAATSLPEEYGLEQNYPNPFNPSTRISFSLPRAEHLTLKIYTLNGVEVNTLVEAQYPAGKHTVVFRPKNLPSGTYFYVMQAGTVRQVRQLMLVK